jgi:antagonist of KipI
MIRVARAGLLTTVQDRGRFGRMEHVVTTAGAMDASALRIANLLVGNTEDAAALECTMVGAALEFTDTALIAIGGGDLGALLDGRPVPLWAPFVVMPGSTLEFSATRAGCRAVLAIAGGIDVPVVLGSRSTDLTAGIGGLDGRALRNGDEIPVGPVPGLSLAMLDRLATDPRGARSAGRSLLPHYAAAPDVRIVLGPEHDRFTTQSRDSLLSGTFLVSPQSNRMGLRLKGPALSLEGPYDLSSSPVVMGMVQVPPSGEPIVLMADHQTIGGYPRIAAVIDVDLPLLAQAPPRTPVRFAMVDVATAQAAYLARERDLRMFAESLRVHYRS